MSNLGDYYVKLAAITAVTDDPIAAPHRITVELYAREARQLYQWYKGDQREMTARELARELIDNC